MEKGKKLLLLALLEKKFGPLSPKLQEQINQLSGVKLDTLSLTFLELKALNELQSWLEGGTTRANAN